VKEKDYYFVVIHARMPQSALRIPCTYAYFKIIYFSRIYSSDPYKYKYRNVLIK